MLSCCLPLDPFSLAGLPRLASVEEDTLNSHEKVSGQVSTKNGWRLLLREGERARVKEMRLEGEEGGGGAMIRM